MEDKNKEKKPPFETVWNNIVANQGNEFYTKRKLPFTYNIRNGNILNTSRTTYNISMTDVQRAFNMLPFDGPATINKIVRGPAYIWVLLHDKRIMG